MTPKDQKNTALMSLLASCFKGDDDDDDNATANKTGKADTTKDKPRLFHFRKKAKKDVFVNRRHRKYPSLLDGPPTGPGFGPRAPLDDDIIERANKLVSVILVAPNMDPVRLAWGKYRYKEEVPDGADANASSGKPTAGHVNAGPVPRNPAGKKNKPAEVQDWKEIAGKDAIAGAKADTIGEAVTGDTDKTGDDGTGDNAMTDEPVKPENADDAGKTDDKTDGKPTGEAADKDASNGEAVNHGTDNDKAVDNGAGNVVTTTTTAVTNTGNAAANDAANAAATAAATATTTESVTPAVSEVARRERLAAAADTPQAKNETLAVEVLKRTTMAVSLLAKQHKLDKDNAELYASTREMAADMFLLSEEDDEDDGKMHSGCSFLVAATLMMMVSPWILRQTGFASHGPIAGSIAARMQNKHLGAVPDHAWRDFLHRQGVIFR